MAPPIGEVKYHAGAKSLGQETFETTAYWVTPSNDPYQQYQGHGRSQGIPGYLAQNESPPPMSIHSQNSFQNFGLRPGMGAPLVKGTDSGGQLNGTQQDDTSGLQQNQYAPTFELPTSNSPMQARYIAAGTFSWSTGGEGRRGRNSQTNLHD